MLLKHIDINDLNTNSDNATPLPGSVPIIGIDRHRFFTDGEGVTTLVAFHGCPLDCKYCLNPQCKSYIREYLNPKQLYDKVKIDDIYGHILRKFLYLQLAMERKHKYIIIPKRNIFIKTFNFQRAIHTPI